MSSSTPLTYDQRIAAINREVSAGNLTQEQGADLKRQAAEGEFGAKAFDINEFQSLLSRLEGSKMRQERQKGVESRRDIMSQGLASMMSNF